jgi:4-carboxymuconolactone decarboxylase
MQSRLPLPDTSAFDAEQRAIHASILATRGNLDGPFLAWMHSPGLASPAEKLGAFCRYGSSLALLESELLILCVARHFDCVGEQQIHEPIAIGAGLSPDAVAAIRDGRTPALGDERQRFLHRLATQFLRDNRIAAADYDAAVAMFGERSLVEIVGILGYYAFVAMTLNAFEMRQG